MDEARKIFKGAGMGGYRFVSLLQDKKGEMLVVAERVYVSDYVKGPYVVYKYRPNKDVKLNFGKFDLSKEEVDSLTEGYREVA